MDRILVEKEDLRVWEISDRFGVRVITDIRDDQGKWHIISILEKVKK